MKTQLIMYLLNTALITAFVACASSPLPPTDSLSPSMISKDLRLEPLNHRTFVIKDTSFYATNVLVSKMPDDTVIIASSPIDTVKTKALLDWVKKALKPKKIIAINTHFHADGTGGNEAYDNSGVEIWSSQQTHKLYLQRAESMRTSLAAFIKDKNHSKNVLARRDLPAHKFFDAKKGLKWNFSGEDVFIKYPGPAHSPDNLVVYFPKQKILFGGCMVRALDWGLGNTKDADVGAYASSVGTLMSLDTSTVVPGHGQVGDRKLLKHTLKIAKKAKTTSQQRKLK